jgi:hypothetical protein
MRANPISTITSYKSSASNLIVLVESQVKNQVRPQNSETTEKHQPEAIYLHAPCRKMIVLLLAIYRGI